MSAASSEGGRCFAIFFTFKQMACLIAAFGKVWDRSVFSLNSFSPVAKLKRVTWPEAVAKMQRPEPTMLAETR